MNKTIALVILGGLLAATPITQAADIMGKITLKGTAPKEKDVPQIKDDPNCGKLHTTAATTHHYVVGPNGELANAASKRAKRRPKRRIHIRDLNDAVADAIGDKQSRRGSSDSVAVVASP